jgi:ribosome-binding factor A
MKPRRSSLEFMKELCNELREDDGVDPREFVKREQRKESNKRDRQLCAQVRRCLDLVLPEMLLRLKVSICEVQSVEPAPDTSRLRVVIRANAAEVERVRQALDQFKGRIRAEVAQAVHRKRTPDLCFTVTPAEEVTNGRE